MNKFSEIAEAADNLSLDEQQTLLELLRHRIAERNREAIVRDVEESRLEFQQGNLKSSSVSEIMDEVKGES